MKRTKGVMAGMACAVSLVVAGCAGGAGDSGEDGAITVANQPNPSGFSLWLAKEKGFYEDAGLQVELMYSPTGAAQLASGVSGDWQAGYMGAPPALTGYDKWGLLPAGTMMRENENIILFVKKEILEGQEIDEVLRSSRVGVTPNSVSEQLLFACAEQFGVSGDQLTTVPLDPAAIVNGMLGDELDAAVTFSAVDWPLVQDEDKYARVCDGNKAERDLVDPFVVTPTFWKERPEDAAAFVDAAYRANEYIRSNPDDLNTLVMDYFAEVGADYPEEAAEYSLSVRNFMTLDEAVDAMSSGATETALSNTSNHLVSVGAFDSEPDVEAMVNDGHEVLQAAAERRE